MYSQGWQGFGKINNYSHGCYNEKKKLIRNYLEENRLFLLDSIQNGINKNSKYIDYTDVLDILKNEDSSILNI